MIKHIHLENFKAFGAPTDIPLAPLTLIYGQNSSGKSSIIQSVALMKQSYAAGGHILSPRVEQGLVDLGSFKDMVFDHDVERGITLGFSVEEPSVDPDTENRIRHYSKSARDFIRKSGDLRKSKETFHLDLHYRTAAGFPFLSSITLYTEGRRRVLARLKNIQSDDDIRSQLLDPIRHGPLMDFGDVEICRDEDIWGPCYQWALDNREYLLHLLSEEIDSEKKSVEETISAIVPDLAEREDVVNLTNQVNRRSRRRVENLEKCRDFYASDFEIEAFISRLEGQLPWLLNGDAFCLSSEVSISGNTSLEAYTTELHFPLLREITKDSNGDWEVGERSQQWLNNPLLKALTLDSYAPRAFKILRSILTDYSTFLGPFRTPPSRFYSLSGRPNPNVGYHGENVPELLKNNRKLANTVNGWLLGLGIPYKLSPRGLGKRMTNYVELRLVDTRRKVQDGERPVEVTLNDVGFGISQILPVVCECVFAENKTIFIEQPELHIHPRLQANLADMFAWSIGARGNQLVVETHSEHLILRLMRRVRESKDRKFDAWPKDLSKACPEGIRPSDLSVLYVEAGEEGSQVIDLPVTADGDFDRPWPSGFFTERMNEVL